MLVDLTRCQSGQRPVFFAARLTAIAFTMSLVAACGSGGASNDQNAPPPASPVTTSNLVTGQVFDALGSGPIAIANAEVTLLFNNTSVTTDVEGRYSIEVPDPLPIAEEHL